jgi:outer membrane receptor protein involved in Fe transport
MKTAAPLLLGLAVLTGPAFGQPQAPTPPPQTPAGEPETPGEEPAGAPAPPRQPPAPVPTRPGPFRQFEEIKVESASRVETTLVNAPATLSVVGSEALATSPAQNYADLLRSVPGMNVIQMSARDFNLTTRQGTSTLNNSQLVLVDGRSVYLDFFGLVLWDFVPDPTSGDVKQIEVVRGPASVVWGANALSGVVNVITKSPRESSGLALTLRAGLFDRAGGSREADGQGGQYGGGFSYSGALDSTWSYRLSAGYFSSDPYSRPVGRVPLACHPLGANPCRDAGGSALPGGIPVGGAEYPKEGTDPGDFVNSGTSQPKADLRIDQDLGEGGRLSYQAGYAGTEGIIHSGIGPFDIESGSYMAYGRAVYDRGALRVATFANFVDAHAPNLLQTDPSTLKPVVLGFVTRSYDMELRDAHVLAGPHVRSYGGNNRHNEFDITMAPGAKDRNELGAYLQEEFFVSRFRLAAGVRADKFGNLDHWVLSPRLSAMYKPTPDHSLRASFNRAFRGPSVINQYMDQSIFSPSVVDLRPLAALLPAPQRGLVPDEPFLLVVKTRGQPDLREERVDALELAYTGTFGEGTSVGLAVYQNDIDHNINFVTVTPSSEHPQGLPGLTYYSVSDPAHGVGTVSGQPITLDPRLMAILARLPAPAGPVQLPETVATYMNLGPIRQRGVEVSVEHRFGHGVSASANYSWQAVPKVLEPKGSQLRYPLAEVEPGPRHRFNVGGRYDGPRAFGALDLSYVSQAFWNDVLDAPYHGFTGAYTMLDATLGVKLADGKLSLSLRGTNLLDRKIQQQVYGDIIRRAFLVQARYYVR